MHAETNLCSFEQSSFAFPYQFTSSPLQLIETGTIIPTQTSISISESDLQTEQGCIDVLGDITDLYEQEQFVISPNPSLGIVTVQSNFTVPTDAKVIDAFGKECGKFRIEHKEIVLDMSYLDAGIYFLETNSSKERIVVLK